MKRQPGWRMRFAQALDAIRRKPFSWEEQHDCGLGLAAPLVLAITGEDVAASFRGQYTTAIGAVKALRKQGYSDVADMVAKLFPEIPPHRAAVGDLVALQAEQTGWALGVVLGERIGVLAPNGFATLDRSKAVRAFRVG